MIKVTLTPFGLRACRTAGVAAVLLFTMTLARAADPPDYQKAEMLVRQGQWDKGIVLLQSVIRADADNLKAHNLLGIAMTGKGDLTRANEQFRRALKIDRRFYPALKNLAINELTLKDAAAAERDFTAALKLAPNDPIIHTYLGEIAYAGRDYQKAATHLSTVGQLLLKDPNLTLHLTESFLETHEDERATDLLKRLNEQGLDSEKQFQAGVILARHEHYSQAVPFFQTVSDRFPDSYDAAFNLALCYVQMKRYPSAIGILERLRSRGRKTAELDNLLAEAYEDNKQTQEAINLLREATLLAPEDENNYLDLAALCIDHSAYELGIEVANVGLRYRPGSDRLVFQRGVLYALLDRFDRAEQDFDLASRMAPQKDLAYVGLGLTFIQKSNLPKAVAVLRQRTREKPEDYLVQYLLGEALIRLGVNPGEPSLAEAQAALEKSVRLNDGFFRSHIDLAKIYLKENRIDEAIKHLEKARRLNTNEKAVYSQLATAYRRKGRTEEAAAMLAVVKKLNDEEREHSYRELVRIVKEGSAQDLALKKLQVEGQQKRIASPQADVTPPVQ